MKKVKTIKLPRPQGRIPRRKPSLPVSNNSNLSEGKFLYSFVSLDREHELFNLGEIGVGWFLELLDCLKEAGTKTIPEMKGGKFKLHPIDWKKANASQPKEFLQQEFWQFRITKGKGRVVGYKIENTFYIVWLDAHHNLTTSEGYGGVQYFSGPKTDYDLLSDEKAKLELENKQLKELFETCDLSNCPYQKKE